MREYTEILKEFGDIAANPKQQLKTLLADGKMVVGCMPYFAWRNLSMLFG